MKKVLIPTDFSVNARKALDYAVLLFEKEACVFYILHAYQMAPTDEVGKSASEKKLKLLQEELETKKKNEQHSFEHILYIDTTLNAINVTLIDKDVDYVIMGTKGSSALKELFMGSTTVNIIKNIDNCPIIAVPLQFKLRVPQEIVFANDYKHFFKAVELTPLIDIVILWDATLNMVYVQKERELDDTQKLNRELLKKSFKKLNNAFLEIDSYSSISQIIKRLERENKNVGMVALLKQRHGFLEKLIREPVIRNVAFNTEVPFLVLPEIS